MFHFADFTLDASRFELLRNGVVVRVERRVFDVIVYLIRHRDRAVMKEELAANVWKQTWLGESVIARSISTARKVIDDPEAIKTVYGRGYRWVAPVEERSASQRAQSPRPAPSKRALPAGTTPLFGRERELELASAAIAEAVGGAGQVLLLAGEAGIGKSRMAQEIARMAESRGMATFSAPSSPETDAGFAAFATILGSMRADARLPESANSVVEFLTRGVRAEEAPFMSSRLALFQTVSALLQSAASEQPIAIVIEDLHRIDPESLLLFEWVAEHVHRSPALLIATYRDAELAENATRNACLVRTIRSVAPRVVALEGLNSEQARLLLSARGGRAYHATLAEAARAVTGGNPFFLLQVAAFLPEEGGSLTELARRLPRHVRDAIVRQLEAVPSACRELLELAAAIGLELEPRILSAASGLDSQAVLALLDLACSAGVLEAAPHDGGYYAFRHELVRQALYEALPSGRRAELHLAVARARESECSTHEEQRASELARHYFRAASLGGASAALRCAEEAGALALQRFAWESAVEHFELAERALVLTNADDPRTLARILVRLGTARLRAGSRVEARATFGRAGELATRLGDGEALLQTALAFSSGIHGIELGFDPALVPLLEAALRLEKLDARSEALLSARLALALFWIDDRPRRSALVQRSRMLAGALPHDAEVAAYVRAAELSILERPGSLALRLDTAAETIELTRRAGAHELCSLALVTRVFTCGEAGDLEGARRHILALEQLAKDTRDPFLSHVAEGYGTLFERIDGDLEALEKLAWVASEAADQLGRPSSRASADTLLIFVRIEQGRASEVLELARRSAAALEHSLPASKLLLTLALIKAGRRAEAARTLGDITTFSKSLRRDPTWLVGMCMLAEQAALLDDREGAASLYRELLPYRDRVVSFGGSPGFFYGSCERYLGLAAATAGEHERASQHFEAALQENAKLGAELALSHTRAEYAALLSQASGAHDERARELWTHAFRAAKVCGFAQLEGELAAAKLGALEYLKSS